MSIETTSQVRMSTVTVQRCGTPDACPVADACSCGSEGHVPCHDIRQAHERKLDLCQVIEAIADALPSAVDRMQCLRVANAVVPLLREAHAYEELYVFPVFERSGAADADARAASVRRLKAEHVEDECAALVRRYHRPAVSQRRLPGRLAALDRVEGRREDALASLQVEAVSGRQRVQDHATDHQRAMALDLPRVRLGASTVDDGDRAAADDLHHVVRADHAGGVLVDAEPEQ